MNWKRRKSELLMAAGAMAVMAGSPRPATAQQDQQQPAATQQGQQQQRATAQQDQQPQPAPTKKSSLFNKLKNAAQTVQNKVQEVKNEAQEKADKIKAASGGAIDINIQGAQKPQGSKDFGDVPVGTTGEIIIRTNAIETDHRPGNANGYIFEVTSIDITGSDKKDFQVADRSWIGPHRDGDTGAIVIHFTPSRKGKETAYITTSTHSLNGGKSWSDFADLVGNGAPQVVNIFIGGAGDETSSHIVQSYEENNRDAFSNPKTSDAKYFAWTQENDIINYINILPANTKINLIGHSYGGDTAMNVVTKCGRQINDLVTVDPVGGWDQSPGNPGRRTKPGEISDEVETKMIARYTAAKTKVNFWVDIDAESSSPDFSDAVAAVGNPWNKVPEGHANVFIPAPGTDHGQFSKLMRTVPPGGRSAEQILKGP